MRWASLVLLALMGCISPIAASANRQSSVARIGVAAPFSGESYLAGYRTLFAVRLAVRQWNEQGGVAGRRIELVALDDEGREAPGQLQARALSLDPELIGVVGHLSSASASAAAPIYAAAGLPALLLGPVEGTAAAPSVFQLSPSLETFGQALSSLILQVTSPPPQRLALLWSVNDPRERPAPLALAVLRRQLEEAGLAVVLQRGISNRVDEAAAAAAELSRERAELAVFLGEADEAATFSRALRALPTSPPLLLAPWTAEPRYLQLAGDSAEAVFYLGTAPEPAAFPPATDFYEAYRKLALASALDIEPGPEGFLAYAGTNVLLQAAQDSWKGQPRQGWDGIAAALRRRDGFETLIDRMAFDDHGQRRPLPLFLFQIRHLRYGGQPLAVVTIPP